MPDDKPILSYHKPALVDLVVVATASTEFESSLICGKLKAAGIRAVPFNGALGSLDPTMHLSGYSVQVDKEDEAAATELLRDTPIGRGDTAAVSQSKPCPTCGDNRTTRPRVWLRYLALVGLLVSLTLLIFGSEMWTPVIPLSLMPLLFQGSQICKGCRKPKDDDGE